MTKTVDIKPSEIESAVIDAPFDKALESFTNEDSEIISLPQNAQLRRQEGKDYDVSQKGNWTREGILYIPKEKPKLVRNSPILKSAKEAIGLHMGLEEFYPTRKQLEQSLTDSVDFPQENIKIPTDKFDSEPLTVYAFGGEKKARAYGEFLDNEGIKQMPVYTINKDDVNKQNQSFARQLWFGPFSYWSGLFGDRVLYDSNLVRGVKQ